MSKIAFLNDTHWGARSDNVIFQKYIADFFNSTFFPYIDEHQIKHVIHLGDLVDRRKYVNFFTARMMHYSFIKPLADRPDVEVLFVLGNHDIFFKDTTFLNCIAALYGDRLYPNMKMISEPSSVHFAGIDIDLYPWITAENNEASLDLMDNPKAEVAFGHFECADFEMQKGSIMNHGMDFKLLSKYKLVGSGHYHEKSSRGNMHYFGVQYPLTWADFESPKGFHVFDTETYQLDFIEYEKSIFSRIVYDGQKPLADNMQALEQADITNKIVRLVVTNRSSSEDYERYRDALDAKNPFQLQVNENRTTLEIDLGVSDSESTLHILKKYVMATEEKDKESLCIFLEALYNDAMSSQIAE